MTRFGTHKRVDDTLVGWFELVIEEHKRETFDVLHAYFITQAGFVATYAGKYLNLPSIVSIRGNDLERSAFDPSRFSHVMYVLQNANAVTTNASELVKKANAFVERKITLIPNGIDTEHFKPMPKNKILAESIGIDDLPTVGFVGELRAKKGLEALLSAYARVNDKQPTVLLIVGEVRAGEDKQVFDKFRISNPESRVVVTGYIAQNDLPAYYSLIDIFVHPSLRDGMPNAVLEAMACEKAVIATPVGGILEAIENRDNGILLPAKDADSLSKAIIELLGDEPLRGRLGKSARQRVILDFTLEKELSGNLEVYRGLGLNP